MTDRPTTEETRSIDVPEELAEAIERRMAGTDFDSVDEYATFALRQLLADLQRRETDDQRGGEQGVERGGEQGVDADHRDAVEQHLDSLGYL
jgi:Arc/MetJ-type ribon-helix-helix transcriptional regulator